MRTEDIAELVVAFFCVGNTPTNTPTNTPINASKSTNFPLTDVVISVI
jgi:hypothetical protein